MDGHCAGAIVKMKHPDAVMHEITYGYDYEKDVIANLDGNDAEIFVVDFRFETSEFQDLIARGCIIHWCDHHETGIKIAAKSKLNDADSVYLSIDGMQNKRKAGAQLTWEYLYPEKPLPLIVHHVSQWDIWNHSDPHTIPYQRGLELSGRTNPVDADAVKLWKAYIENSREGNRRDFNELDALLNMGLTGEAMKAQYDTFIGSSAYYIPEWEGFRTVALNSRALDSYVIFEHADKWEEFDPEVLIWYHQSPTGQWKYSIRNYPGTDTSVIELAEKYNGGGHRKTAGFTTDELIIFPIQEDA
jgi:oligoribonuclease NrnB/cAMP/cGMP phosphodiesterase (DHH superfamily)